MLFHPNIGGVHLRVDIDVDVNYINVVDIVDVDIINNGGTCSSAR